MRSASAGNWRKTRRDSPAGPASSRSSRPPSPPLPLPTRSPSKFSSLHSVFRRSTRPLSTAHSTPTPAAYTSTTTSQSLHPYSAVMHAPHPVVGTRDPIEDEAECPVCLEPLSFSFRLPGEKPHIVPECGHALHEACFTAVYGPPPSQSRATAPRKTNVGVCGVCRRPMKVGDGDGGKSNKLAALTGMGDSNSEPLYPGRDTPIVRPRQPQQSPSPNDDDPIENTGSVRSNTGTENSQYVVTPSIQVRPEFPSLTRTPDPSQPLTCILIVELPGKRALGTSHTHVSGDNHPRNGNRHHRKDTHSEYPQPDLLSPSSQLHLQSRDPDPSFQHSLTSPPVSQHPTSAGGTSGSYDDEDSPFTAITDDLRNRIIDWKGHPLSDLGSLRMYDLLSVRRDSAVRDFYVYLFKEAIICVVEEKKWSLGRLLSNASGFTDSNSIPSSSQSKSVLRLKGRIYIRHIKNVTASSAAGEMSLTIDMEDELASFILIFKDRSSMEAWKSNIQSLVDACHVQSTTPQHPEPTFDMNMEEFGPSPKAMRVLSGSTQTTASSADSLLNSSSRSTLSSSTSHGSHPRTQVNKLATLGEVDELGSYDSPPTIVTPYTSSGPSNSLTPLRHPPMDLILVISVPSPSAVPSTALLKFKVIRATLDFMVASMGKGDRLSVVTYEVGPLGRVRKTPFLNPNKALSRARLEKFIEGVAMNVEDSEDEFLVRGQDEKTDVVTAVNHAFDVVLQRKARNPISGMILVSDAADSTRRAQMDLVLARAEAANVPIHSFGYGRSHDPASLWLMSNHTSGTYTFVKDWYDLRDCIAGCVGGMMSIGLLNMKLHMKVVDGHRFKIRKVSGGPSSILSSDGQNVDIDIGELRYGERKEMLVELELDNSDTQRIVPTRNPRSRALNATDQFVQSMGLESLAIDDPPDFTEGMMDRMIDEVPVVEVDGSFFDPAVSKSVTRLVHPVLLTITLLPQSSSVSRASSPFSDPVIVRRRMEILASDMITRALVLVSRRNFPQAQKIMGETKRILHTVLQTISRTLPQPPSPSHCANGSASSSARNRKEQLNLAAARAMQAILQDLQILEESLEDSVELFARDQRNFGAQQAMILRDQKSWTGRSATERLFWTTDYSIELVSRSTDWFARE